MFQKIAALFISFKALFGKAYTGVKPTWEKIAMRVPSTASKEVYSWLAALPGLRKWVGDRVCHILGMHKYEIPNEDYELTVAVKVNDIEDDQTGVYAPLISAMGVSAANWVDELVYQALKDGFTVACYDGQPFFDTDHPNFDEADTTFSNYQSGTGAPWFLMCTSAPIKPIIFQERQAPKFTGLDKADDENVFKKKEILYGVDARGGVGYGLPHLVFASKAALTPENYEAARAAIMSRTSSAGTPLGLVPDLLVVAPTLEGAARRLLNNEQIDGSTNEWKGTAELLVAPRLA